MSRRGISTIAVAGIIIVILVVAAVAVYIYTRPPAGPPRVGLILGTGGLGDKSFNDLSFEGARKANETLGIEYDYVEPQDIAEYEGYQRDFARSGKYAIIIGIGFDQLDPMTKVAGEYPNQKFALIDENCTRPNVASLLFRANEGSFLVGVVAGMKTRTGKVGFIGGMDIPLIRDFFAGYEAGVKWANSTVEVKPPVFVGGWGDPTTANELAISLADSGVDAIYPPSGKSGIGAFEAIHQRGILGLGYDACMCYLHPSEIKASMTKRVDLAVFETINATIEGTFEGGAKVGGIKEGWVGSCRLPEQEDFWEEKYEFTHSALEAAVLDKMVEARDKIISGEITVPSGV